MYPNPAAEGYHAGSLWVKQRAWFSLVPRLSLRWGLLSVSEMVKAQEFWRPASRNRCSGCRPWHCRDLRSEGSSAGNSRRLPEGHAGRSLPLRKASRWPKRPRNYRDSSPQPTPRRCRTCPAGQSRWRQFADRRGVHVVIAAGCCVPRNIGQLRCKGLIEAVGEAADFARVITEMVAGFRFGARGVLPLGLAQQPVLLRVVFESHST